MSSAIMNQSRSVSRLCLVQVLFALVNVSSTQRCVAFAPSSYTNGSRGVCEKQPFNYPRNNRNKSYEPATTLLSSNKGQYDITKPTFDLLSFRPIRSDALLRYNSLNQSEPLRINLFLLATISFFGYPLWCESVTGDVPTLSSSVGAAALGVGAASLFWRERSRRSNQLRRMEKELNAGSLAVKLPVSAAISSIRPEVQLMELRSKRRVVAIRGSKEQLKSSGVIDMLCVLRRRLVQSQTLVVILPTDGTLSKSDCGLDDEQLGDALWLGDACNVAEWDRYFNGLAENPGEELAWFALNFNGRSIASGLSEAPRLIELLGQQLQPMEILDESDKAEVLEGDKMSTVEQILEKQKQFYKVLTDSDDETQMKAVYSKKFTDEVNEVLTGGGRIDTWSTCLEPSARPSGMTISGSDVYLPSKPNVAYSTCIEFPSNAGIDGATLLAVQRWSRESEGDEWKLDLHQTIPWSTGSRAGGTLRCDCRGCVALARAVDKRTFGGLIG